MALLQDRPIIITQPGDYVTRKGRRVTISAIQGPGTFSAKGAVWREFRGKVRPRGYDIWHPCGAHGALGESGLDIIGPWTGEA